MHAAILGLTGPMADEETIHIGYEGRARTTLD